MATRIRLQRHGKKSKAFFHLVVADSRAKRDGKFIEKLGIYNPNTNPATIEINFESTLSWLETGAEMSDTARAILSYKGILYKNHLKKGVLKGALTEADVETKFNAWLAEKDNKVNAKKEGITTSTAQSKATALKAESDANEARAKAIEVKNTPVEEVVETEAVVEESIETETVVEETVVEETITEENTASTEEVVSEEVSTEEIAEEKAPEEEGTKEA